MHYYAWYKIQDTRTPVIKKNNLHLKVNSWSITTRISVLIKIGLQEIFDHLVEILKTCPLFGYWIGELAKILN